MSITRFFSGEGKQNIEELKARVSVVEEKIRNVNLNANENISLQLIDNHAYILIACHSYHNYYGIYLIPGGYTTAHITTVNAYSGMTVEKTGNSILKVSSTNPAFLTLIG